MNTNTKNTIIFGLIAVAIILLLLINEAENESSIFFAPAESDSGVTQIDENLFVSERNAGPMNFEAAEMFCESKGMHLPTREQAWQMWLASSNCKMAMVTSRQIIKDKKTFINSCHDKGIECTVSSDKVDYKCNPNADLLFLDEKSFRYGNYWLKDRYDRNGHYTANFINGVTNAYRDDIKLLGVRCVRENK